MTDNLDLWNRVGTTDTRHTKQVKLGRTITAIDPYRQIEAATAEFGPVGVGWGYKVVSTLFTTTDECCVIIRMWTKSKDNYFEHSGQNGLYLDNDKKKADKDFLKKAITDGVTKCLSILGFNNDIFLGKFDDSKYVQELENKQAWCGPLKKAALSKKLRECAFDISQAEAVLAIDQLYKDYLDVLNQAQIDDPIALDGDGEDNIGIWANMKNKKEALQKLEAEQGNE